MATQATEIEQKHLDAWQRNLLPLLIIVPTDLMGVFVFLASHQWFHVVRCLLLIRIQVSIDWLENVQSSIGGALKKFMRLPCNLPKKS